MFRLKDAIKVLHARKDRAYGGAWKRRGERISVLPNIARKIDRIEAFAEKGIPLQGETIVDTAVDLYVYAAKYRLFLVEQPGADISFIAPDAPTPFSDREENFNSLVDLAKFQCEVPLHFAEHANSMAASFDRLWRAADANASIVDRQQLAKEFSVGAERLVGIVARDYPTSLGEFVNEELKTVASD